jgi:DNA-binding Lrp family transcriptional regulator
MRFSFEFSENEFEDICKKAMLNDELKQIFKMRIQDNSIVEISQELNMCERTVYRRLKKLKRLIKKVL